MDKTKPTGEGLPAGFSVHKWLARLLKQVFDFLDHGHFINVLCRGQFLHQQVLGRIQQLAFTK
jgi:hypothetical protein